MYIFFEANAINRVFSSTHFSWEKKWIKHKSKLNPSKLNLTCNFTNLFFCPRYPCLPEKTCTDALRSFCQERTYRKRRVGRLSSSKRRSLRGKQARSRIRWRMIERRERGCPFLSGQGDRGESREGDRGVGAVGWLHGADGLVAGRCYCEEDWGGWPLGGGGGGGGGCG